MDGVKAALASEGRRCRLRAQKDGVESPGAHVDG